jgi:uncharacterized protein (DUF849 family)
MEAFSRTGTKPELEAYDAGMINNIAYLISKGFLKKPVYIQFVMGVLGGITPSPENLMFMIDYARRLIGDFEFSVCAAGQTQFSICTQSLIMGGLGQEQCGTSSKDDSYCEGTWNRARNTY